MLQPPTDQSFFLFGPRGTGKTAWIREQFPKAVYVDLLDEATFARTTANPASFLDRIPSGHRDWVILDEVQRVPEILNEVHRRIESHRTRFVLTGSSARKLRTRGVNLLAGRALLRYMHPLTAHELGKDFDVRRSLVHGCLPFACTSKTPAEYLRSYVGVYLREEVLQEGLTRNLGSFSRFLEIASLSQGSVLNRAAVARDSNVNVKVAASYFEILEDLLIAVRVPVFTRRAKRKIVQHPKFYFFDTGVFRSVRPRGPLDSEEEIEGPALETLFLQQVRALNDYLALEYSINYWRTNTGAEVDFVLYGKHGLHAFEIKRGSRVRAEDLAGLKLFREDYPMAKTVLLYGGTKSWHESGIDIRPYEEVVRELPKLLGPPARAGSR